jgi:alpha-beta hydrolase superfamily lysophospholipase
VTAVKERLILLVPGNPGDAYYYGGFAGALRERGYEVAVFDHARLSRAPTSMLVYAQHQAAQLEAYLRQSGRGKADVEVVVVGHSVGAYVAHLIEKHALLPVSRIVHLFPFFARPSRRAFVSLAVWGWFGPQVLGFFRRLPRAWQHAWLRRAGVHAHREHVITTLYSEHARSYTSMGSVEFAEITRYQDASHVVSDSPLARQGKVACLFADGDHWSPAREHPDVRAISYRLTRSVSHTFVLDQTSWPTVADALEALLDPSAEQGSVERFDAAPSEPARSGLRSPGQRAPRGALDLRR